jgi:hypothetical protein
LAGFQQLLRGGYHLWELIDGIAEPFLEITDAVGLVVSLPLVVNCERLRASYKSVGLTKCYNQRKTPAMICWRTVPSRLAGAAMITLFGSFLLWVCEDSICAHDSLPVARCFRCASIRIVYNESWTPSSMIAMARPLSQAEVVT